MISRQKKYWKNRAPQWISQGQFTWHNSGIEFVEYLKNHVDATLTILDIGVGTGHYLENFKNCKKIYGIDFMESFIKIANKVKPANCELFVDDVVDLKINAKPDLVFTMTVLQHVHPDEVDVAIKNICQLGSNDIILWEATNETWDNSRGRGYMFAHNFEELFMKYNYHIYYKKLGKDNIKWIIHFKKTNNSVL